MKNFHLNREDVVFTFIDIQDKLLKAMYNKDQIVKNSTVLAKVASTIGAEAIYTVQYPKGLGLTNEEVKAPLKDKKEFGKLTFNSYGDEEIKKNLTVLVKNKLSYVEWKLIFVYSKLLGPYLKQALKFLLQQMHWDQEVKKTLKMEWNFFVKWEQ